MLFNVEAPAGKLGLHFADAPGKQSALVYEVNQTSPIVRSIEVGDVITAVNGRDTTALGREAMVDVLARSADAARALTVRRGPIVARALVLGSAAASATQRERARRVVAALRAAGVALDELDAADPSSEARAGRLARIA